MKHHVENTASSLVDLFSRQNIQNFVQTFNYLILTNFKKLYRKYFKYSKFFWTYPFDFSFDFLSKFYEIKILAFFIAI